MLDEVAQTIRETEQRISAQIDRIRKHEGAGRWSDAQRARETLAVITETRDALRLRLKVAEKALATQARWASLVRILPCIRA